MFSGAEWRGCLSLKKPFEGSVVSLLNLGQKHTHNTRARPTRRRYGCTYTSNTLSALVISNNVLLALPRRLAGPTLVPEWGKFSTTGERNAAEIKYMRESCRNAFMLTLFVIRAEGKQLSCHLPACLGRLFSYISQFSADGTHMPDAHVMALTCIFSCCTTTYLPASSLSPFPYGAARWPICISSRVTGNAPSSRSGCARR